MLERLLGNRLSLARMAKAQRREFRSNTNEERAFLMNRYPGFSIRCLADYCSGDLNSSALLLQALSPVTYCALCRLDIAPKSREAEGRHFSATHRKPPEILAECFLPLTIQDISKHQGPAARPKCHSDLEEPRVWFN